MKLKDFINVLDAIYSITLYDDSDCAKLFSCKTDSKALLNYKEWEIVEISISYSLVGCATLEVCIREGVNNNE